MKEIKKITGEEAKQPLPLGMNWHSFKVIDIGKQKILCRSTVLPTTDNPIIKLNATEFLDKRTGEVREFNAGNSRTNDRYQLMKTFSDARNRINYNIQEPEKVMFLTLTYKENVQDTEKVRRDFDNFRRLFLKPTYGQHEYITALEPQGRGAWHLHVLLIFQDKLPYFDAKSVRKAWGKGAIRLERIDSVENAGAYLSAYLTDIYNESEHMREKHARLSRYPKQCHIFRWSKGIKKPPETRISQAEFEALLRNASVQYQTCFSVTEKNDDTERAFTVYNQRIFIKT